MGNIVDLQDKQQQAREQEKADQSQPSCSITSGYEIQEFKKFLHPPEWSM